VFGYSLASKQYQCFSHCAVAFLGFSKLGKSLIVVDEKKICTSASEIRGRTPIRLIALWSPTLSVAVICDQ